MTDDEFEMRAAAGDLPPLPEPPVAAPAVRPTKVTVRAAAPEPDSFRRSEATLAGLIARAVARGQRVL